MSNTFLPFDLSSIDHYGNWISSIRGLHYENINAGSTPASALGTPYIPEIGHGGGKLFSSTSPAYVAVALEDFITSSGSGMKQDLRSVLKIPSEAKIIALLHGNDEVLDKYYRHENMILSGLAEEDIHACVAPNFSVWDVRSIEEQNVNLKRSLVSYDRMNKLGIPSIPHFYWKLGYSEDIIRTARWLNLRPSIESVAFSFQTYSPEQVWLRVISEFKQLVALIGRAIHFIIIGVADTFRIGQLAQILGKNFTLINSAATVLAWSRRRLLLDGPLVRIASYQKRNDEQTSLFSHNFSSPTVGELFSDNCSVFAKIASGEDEFVQKISSSSIKNFAKSFSMMELEQHLHS